MTTSYLPAYTEDLNYPAYNDRLTLGTVAKEGVIGFTELGVGAGSGTQVNVNAGRAYIKASTSNQSSAIFDNRGLYEYTYNGGQPYNTVVVSSVNPQIAQIILRVYDIKELGIAGASFARIEWLNGTPTAGATLNNRNGVAELPVSCLRLADVLIPKNATKSSEFTIRDRRPWAHGGVCHKSVLNYNVTTNGYIVIPELTLRMELLRGLKLSLWSSKIATTSGSPGLVTFQVYTNIGEVKATQWTETENTGEGFYNQTFVAPEGTGTNSTSVLWEVAAKNEAAGTNQLSTIYFEVEEVSLQNAFNVGSNGNS